MKRKKPPRTRLSWQLQCPNFEIKHWWREEKWAALVPPRGSVDKSKKPYTKINSSELRAAISWEVIRRLPYSGGLLAELAVELESWDPSKPIQTMRKVYERANGRGIDGMLLSHGEKSWDSLSIRERAAVAGSLGAGNCHAQQNGGNRQYRATPIRDLFTEAVHRVCSFPIYKFDELPLLRWEYEWRPTPKSEEEWQQLSLNIRQMERQLCSEAEANGYKPMLIAIDPSMASGLDLQKFILKMYKSRFGNIPRIRTRCNPLEIIEKFETDNLKRSDPYGGKTLDLRPYRELLEEYEKAYGFPKEWKTNE